MCSVQVLPDQALSDFQLTDDAGEPSAARLLDSRLRGNAGRIAALVLESAEVLQTIRRLL